MSTEFPLFWPRIRLGDFCNSKLKRWQGNTTRCPSQKPDQRFDVRACFEALYQLEGARAALLSTDVRVMLWSGRKDLAHDKMQGARRQGKAELFSVQGDHLGPSGTLNLVDRACVVAILLAVVTLANLAYHLIHKPTKLCLVGNRLDKEQAATGRQLVGRVSAG